MDNLKDTNMKKFQMENLNDIPNNMKIELPWERGIKLFRNRKSDPEKIDNVKDKGTVNNKNAFNNIWQAYCSYGDDDTREISPIKRRAIDRITKIEFMVDQNEPHELKDKSGSSIQSRLGYRNTDVDQSPSDSRSEANRFDKYYFYKTDHYDNSPRRHEDQSQSISSYIRKRRYRHSDQSRSSNRYHRDRRYDRSHSPEHWN